MEREEIAEESRVHVSEARRRSRPVAIGDVFEIETPAGLAYLQYTHEDDFGPVVRILPGTFKARPTNIESMVLDRTRFAAIIPVVAGVREGSLVRLGSFGIPGHAAEFPLMLAVKARLDGTLRWSIWDGTRMVKSDLPTLAEAEMDYPHRSILNREYLVDRIASDWTWRDETQAEIKESLAVQSEDAGSDANGPSLVTRIRGILTGR